MALEIIWTPQAYKGLQNVLAYLEEEWTEREILNLEQRLKEFLERVSKYPKI